MKNLLKVEVTMTMVTTYDALASVNEVKEELIRRLNVEMAGEGSMGIIPASINVAKENIKGRPLSASETKMYETLCKSAKL